jgi:hypothetical protein
MKKLIFAFLITTVSIFAQDLTSSIELLKSDIKTEKKKIISEKMNFSEQEAKIFWNLYRDYEVEMDKLADKRMDYIQEYAENYPNISEKKAEEIMNNAFDYFNKRLKLREKFYKKIKEKLGAVKSAKYLQLDQQIQAIIDVQISSLLPLLDNVTKRNVNSK